MSGWSDVELIATGLGHSIGLKTDRTVVAVGRNDSDQCNVSDWNLGTPCPIEDIYGKKSDETELLRYLRDNVLTKSLEGQEIIRLYYELSPFIVKAMQEDEKFKQLVKEMIDGILPLTRESVE